jgi:hypothetical protein
MSAGSAEITLPKAVGERSTATNESRRTRLKTVCSVLLGTTSLGCGPGYHWSSSAFFANATREPVSVRVQTLQAEVDCAKVVGRSSELLAHRELFGEPITYQVPAGEALPLELEQRFGAPQLETCAVLIQVIGLPDQVVVWSAYGGTSTASKLAETGDPDFRKHSVILEGHRDVKGLAIGDGLEVTPLPPANAASPPLDEPPPVLGWSGLLAANELTLLGRRQLPDGCFSLEFASATETASLFLCAPEWSFPFLEGDELNVSAGARQLRVWTTEPGPRLEIWLDTSAADEPVLVTSVQQLGPPGHRTACGAYAEPFSITLPSLDATLSPGEEATTVRAGRRLHALLGRADNVLVAPFACGTKYASLGARFDLLRLETIEESL